MAYGILHEVLALGVNSNASDWHIKEHSPVNLRIEGKMVATDLTPDNELMLKIIDEMIDGDERKKKKFFDTGDIDLSYVEEDVGRFRVNIHRQRGNHGITMRHVKTRIRTFEELAVPPFLRKLADSERGIIIISGTTGSGKSTTLAAMLDHINQSMRKHIITVEDPIEYEFFDKQSFFEQREVGLDTITFYSALTHALRQDPDVIMVGEMRDKESFEAALQAADTGHLVLTTLHSSTASQAVNRILDFYEFAEQGPIRDALALNLRAIVAQRLIPKAFGGGVVPAVEIMINTAIIRKLLEDNRLENLAEAIEVSQDEGVQSFNKCLYNLVNNGDITEEDAMLAASNPDALKMRLKGIMLDSSQSGILNKGRH